VAGLLQTSSDVTMTPKRGLPSSFVNLLKSEEAREQIVLIVDGPIATGPLAAYIGG
jgi:hypothetical protein